MSRKINYSKEVFYLLKKEKEMTVNKKCCEISSEGFLYLLVHQYINNSKDTLESKELYDIFDDLMIEDKLDLERKSYNLFLDYLKKKQLTDPIFDEFLRVNKRLSFNPEFDLVIERAIEISSMNSDMKDQIAENQVITLKTFDILKALLYERESKVTKLLYEYGISVEEVIGDSQVTPIKTQSGEFNIKSFFESLEAGLDPDFIKGLSSSMNSGDLKEKRLEYDDEEDNNKKSSSMDDSLKNRMDKFERAGGSGAISGKKADPKSKTPNLDQFATEMTKEAKEGKYDVVIGRDKEIKDIIEIISCKKKCNAILLGDAGVGKTAILELLAQRIVSGNVPRELKDKRIFNLDLNSLVAGTTFRGQYEERLQKIIKEVTEDKNIIIYIDEFHNLIGNGSGKDGQGDASNILKPYLARGEFKCIGSTTVDEYRKFVEKDKALNRRFYPVFIEEPSIEDTKIILHGIARGYEKYHHVKYPEEVLDLCVDWSNKYINGKFFPDKAITVLDKAGSKTKLLNPADYHEVEEIEKTIESMEAEKNKIVLENNVEEWEKADKIRREIKDKKKQIEDIKTSIDTDETKWPVVDIELISKTISDESGVPIDKIRNTDISKIKEMNAELKKSVIGQDEATKTVTTALQRNTLGLRNPNKPIASFLFVGPTGVGKTHISKIVAKEFFGSDKNILTISCSEYMQEWSESKLLGSAPGYVGFSDSEPVLYKIKRQPYSVVLIDEIEKSNNNLYNIWLNILEEGEVTLSTGEKVSFRNCIIIFTGNVGTKSLELKGDGMGFSKPEGESKKKADVSTVMREVKKEFRPEFLNRLNNIIVFNSLEKNDLKEIFNLELKKLQDRLKNGSDSKFDLTVSDNVADMIISECEPQYGARSLQRLIIKHIEDEICSAMLEKDTTGKTKINIDMKDSKVDVEFA